MADKEVNTFLRGGEVDILTFNLDYVYNSPYDDKLAEDVSDVDNKSPSRRPGTRLAIELALFILSFCPSDGCPG